MDKLEYKLNDEINELNNKFPKEATRTIVILIVIIILLIGGLIASVMVNLSDKNNKGNKPKEEDSLIKIIYNISYGYQNKIINSFKKGSENYNETLGNINKGLDYEANENNIYDIYIPYITTLRKNKYNKIILLIHGGGWMGGYKKDYHEECISKSNLGYIAANMEYNFLTVLGGDNITIFRILDEITAIQEDIKRTLKLEGFDINKLEMCIGGASAGAHLSLLYGYWFKKSPIPIKFVYNQLGPVSLEFGCWWFLSKRNFPLNDIEPNTIESAKKNGTIINNKDAYYNNTILTVMMNLFLGRPAIHNFDKMLIKDSYEINTESTDFQNLLSLVKIGFPIYHVDKNTLPTLCAYGGNDFDIGISHYSVLKEKFEECDNNNLTIVYSKNSDHNRFETNSEEGKNAKMLLELKFLEFTAKYFSKD